MATDTTSLKAPLALAGVWLATASASALAVPVIVATVPYWHTVRVYLEQLGLWQTWISIAACLGLLMLSKRKHAETQEAWAQGPLLIYVLGGMLTAILLNYGVLPGWLVKPSSLWQTAQVIVILLLHWCCAWLALRSLRKSRAQG